MTKLTRTATYALMLTNLGIPCKVTAEHSEEADGEIEITGTQFTVQVGDNYLILGQWTDAATLVSYPAQTSITKVAAKFQAVKDAK